MMLMTEEKKDFKTTDVGLIPEDWEVNDLGKTSTLKARIGWQGLRTDEYLESGSYYLVTGTDFKNGRIDWDQCFFVDKERYDQDRNIQLMEDDILITKDGTIGKVALVRSVPKPATLNSGVFVIRPRSNEYIPRYLYYLFQGKVFKSFLDQLTAGSTINHLYQKDFVNFKYPTPPTLAEQQAIASALSDVDELIRSLDRLIQKKQAIKKGTMQQLLTGKKRLLGFDGEWEVRKIDDIAPLQRGYDLPKSQLKKGKHPVVYSNGIGNYHDKCMEKGPGVVTGRSGTLGRITYVEDDYWPHNTSLWVTDFKGNIPRYIYYLYSFINLEKFGSGSGVPTLNRNDVHEHEILIPESSDEQLAISNILDDMDRELQTLRQKREKYVQIKQGMMQQLLTGRIRIFRMDG